MKNIKKQILLRSLLGAPLGLTISTIVTIVISLIVGDGAYHAVAPEFVSDCGGELNAVIAQAVLSLIYGAAWGGASVVFELDEWSILKQTLVHLGVCSAASFPIAYFARWMPHGWKPVLLYVAAFFGVYFVIWLAQYIPLRRRVKRINDTLPLHEKK